MLAASISYILIKEMGNAAAWLYGVCLAHDTYVLLHRECSLPALLCWCIHSRAIVVSDQEWRHDSLSSEACKDVCTVRDEVRMAKVMLLQVAQDRPAVDEGEVPGLALVLVLPGVTVPWAHALYLWCATAFSLGVHEVCCIPQAISQPAVMTADSCGTSHGTVPSMQV